MMIFGRFRISFNRVGAAPLVWSIAQLSDGGEPLFELAVAAIGIDGAKVVSVYAPKPTPDDEDGQPSAYLVVRGHLTLDESGVALISPEVADQ